MSGWVAPSRLGFGWGGWHPYTWVYCGLILFTRQLNLLRLHRLQIAPNARQLILATLTSARSRQGLVGVGGTLTSASRSRHLRVSMIPSGVGRGGSHPHVRSVWVAPPRLQHPHVSTLTSARSRRHAHVRGWSGWVAPSRQPQLNCVGPLKHRGWVCARRGGFKEPLWGQGPTDLEMTVIRINRPPTRERGRGQGPCKSPKACPGVESHRTHATHSCSPAQHSATMPSHPAMGCACDCWRNSRRFPTANY